MRTASPNLLLTITEWGRSRSARLAWCRELLKAILLACGVVIGLVLAPATALAHEEEVHKSVHALLLRQWNALHQQTGGQQISQAQAPDGPTSSDPSIVGQWGALMSWPTVAIHMALLPNGNVVFWDRGMNGTTATATLWNPTSGLFTSVPDNSTGIFCAGNVMLVDGRLLTVGGHGVTDGDGAVYTMTFDSSTNTWTRQADMNFARWYPAAVTLPDGRVLALGGQISTNPDVFSDAPEVYNPATNTWAALPGATLDLENYPDSYVLPDGRILTTEGADPETRTLDVLMQAWADVGPNPVAGGTSVMYRPGQAMETGGPDLLTTAILDMTQPSPAWVQTAKLSYPRFQHDLVVLPDGNVLAIGGSSDPNINSTNGVLPAELWDATSQTWSTMAAMQDPRMYHSTAVLLPDGRVLSAGGGEIGGAVDYPTAQIFSPPYLFKGARPTITSAPASTNYGTTMTVASPDASSIASVALVRMASSTHTESSDQRYVPLTFTAGSGSLSVQSPATASLAPPGYYMLFLVNGSGVPSVAAIVLMGNGQVTYDPNATATVTPTGTATSTPTPTPTATSTPTATPTVPASAVIFSDGFDETSFAAGGWSLDVAGTGASAQLVTSPVWSGAQAGSFSTLTQSSGQHAFAEHDFSWPSSQVVEARTMVQPQVSAIQFNGKVFSLETRGPHSWGVRSGFALGPSTFGVIYTTRDGVFHYIDLGLTYQSGQWYELALSVDYRGSNPVLQFQIGGTTVYSVTDTTVGTNIDVPIALRVGFGPGAWGNNSGGVTVDDAFVWDVGAIPLTPTATATSTSTSTPTPTITATTTNTPNPTSTPTSVPTPTPAPTDTVAPSATSTATNTATPTPTVTPTPTLAPTRTPTPRLTRTPTNTPRATPTPTATFRLRRTPTPTPGLALFDTFGTSAGDPAMIDASSTDSWPPS
jgi:hypothetical protein